MNQAVHHASRITSTFISSGVLCAATLHLPQNYDGQNTLPAILMIHGWGGIQEALVSPFHQAFTAAGFAVMTFDYAGWGYSQGLPRNGINPWQRERDADAALAHLRSQPQVDARKIVLWGSSFGGGHTVALAAQHPSLLGAIAHVPMLDGQAAMLATPPRRAMRMLLAALRDLLPVGTPHYVPIISPEGRFSTMDRDRADWALTEGLKREGITRRSFYDNRVRARSTLLIGLYRPFKKLKSIAIPTLLVGANNDTVAPFVSDKITAANNPHLQTHSLPANHFEPYFEPVMTPNIQRQLQFLQELLAAA